MSKQQFFYYEMSPTGKYRACKSKTKPEKMPMGSHTPKTKQLIELPSCVSNLSTSELEEIYPLTPD